ncbi:MAG: glycosyltransferase family 4 protein [Anaerolineae bacterium]
MTEARYNFLMLSGDNAIARGQDGAFYQMLGHFARHWARIDILTPFAPDARPRNIHERVFVHPAPYHRALQPLFIKQQGERLLAKRPYHLVSSHDFGFFYNGIGAQWLLRGRDIPLVSEIHHIEGYPIASTFRERLWRASASCYIPFIARHGAHFRVVNDAIAEQLMLFGADPARIHTLYSIYLDLDAYQARSIPKLYDVLFIARLAPNKGVHLLMDAILQVRRTHPQVTLAIRGDGALRGEIERFIAEHDLQANVILLPRVSDSREMPALYQQARMLVCASTVEGNPRVTVEAMACAVPVISTRVGIMPQLIDDDTNGLLVDWSAEAIAGAILRLLGDDERRTRIGNAGRQAVQQFDAETVIKAYAHAYHTIIEAHR